MDFFYPLETLNKDTRIQWASCCAYKGYLMVILSECLLSGRPFQQSRNLKTKPYHLATNHVVSCYSSLETES